MFTKEIEGIEKALQSLYNWAEEEDTSEILRRNTPRIYYLLDRLSDRIDDLKRATIS